MKYCMITFRSVMPAQRGEAVLRRAGLECAIQRTPRWMEEQGCGYCIRLRAPDAAAAAEILRRQEIAFRKLYLLREGGKVEQLHL